jgi:hypothetical protein
MLSVLVVLLLQYPVCVRDEVTEENKKNKKQATTPICAEWLSILVAEEIHQRPNMSNDAMSNGQ